MNTLIFSDSQNGLSEVLQSRSAKESIIFEDLTKLSLTLDCFLENHFLIFVSHLSNSPNFTLKDLAKIYRVLKPNGHINIRFTSISESEYQNLLKMLKACGFQNKNPMNNNLSNELLFYKPELAVPIILNKEKEIKKNEEKDVKEIKASDVKNIVGEYGYDKIFTIDPLNEKKINPFEKVNVNNETINENDLLKDEEYVAFQKKEESCDTKPKACKNCSCGRKELEDKAELDENLKKDLESGNIKSSCGNCYLGDAFRCATCPYKGLPAFQPGEKVTIKIDETKFNEESELGINIAGGKVKLI